MVEGTTKAKDTNTGHGGESRKSKLKRCIGLICFDAEGYLDVKIDKKKDPECAELVNKFIMARKKVRFTIEEDIELG